MYRSSKILPMIFIQVVLSSPQFDCKLFTQFQDKEQNLLETEITSAKLNIVNLYEIDTTRLDFVPIFNGSIRSYKAVLNDEPINKYPVYAELLFVERKSCEIVASYNYCKNGMWYYVVFDNDYGYTTTGCTKKEFVSGVNFKCHRKIEKLKRKGHSGIYLMDNEELLYYESIEDESPVHVCQ